MAKYNDKERRYYNNPGQGRRRRPYYYNAPEPAEKAAFIQLLVENVFQVGER